MLAVAMRGHTRAAHVLEGQLEAAGAAGRVLVGNRKTLRSMDGRWHSREPVGTNRSVQRVPTRSVVRGA